MKKIEDIKYSGSVFTKRVTEGATDYYFLVVDLDLRAKSFPSNNIPLGKPHHVFELPISEQKYEELRKQLNQSRGDLRLAEGTISLSQNEELENRLIVNKAYLSAQNSKLPSKKPFRGHRGHSSGLFSVKDI